MREVSELRKNIERSLTDASVPLWFPKLSKDLAQIGWDALFQSFQLTPANYGTNRLLLGNPDASRHIITQLPKEANSHNSSDVILVEGLCGKTLDFYTKQEVHFYSPPEILDSSVMEILLEAFRVISLVPSLQTTVFDLVKVIHLIKSDEAGEFDISFSEPQVPFSIFTSVPPKRVFADVLRVTEAIVHEAMHLQLTLIESVTTLINSNNGKYYSPWRKEYRTVGGLIHALYVFQVLDCLFQFLLDYNLLSLKEEDYLTERKCLIAKQVVEVQDFANCSDLSYLGKHFIDRLLSKI